MCSLRQRLWAFHRANAVEAPASNLIAATANLGVVAWRADGWFGWPGDRDDRRRVSLKIGSDLTFRNGADSHEAAAKESTYA